MLTKGCSDSDVEKRSCVAPRYVRDLKRNGHKQLRLFEVPNTTRVRMNRSQGYYSFIKEGVIELLNMSRSLQFPIAKYIIRLQAKQVRDIILSSRTLYNDTKQRIKSFKASAV